MAKQSLLSRLKAPFSKKKSAPALTAPAPMGPLLIPPMRDPNSLAALSEVPEHVRKFTESLAAMRNDSLLDGLIGTNVHDGTGFGGGWSNGLTGAGTRRDKLSATRFDEPTRIDDPTLAALWNGNWIAQRIVGTKAKEMFRRGWVLAIPGGPDDVKNTMKTTVPAGVAAAAGKPAPEPKPGSAVGGGVAPPTDPKKPSRSDSVDDPKFDRPDANGMPAKVPPPNPHETPDPHEGEGEDGPAAPSPQAVPADKTPGPGADKSEGDQNSNADIAKAAETYAGKLNHKAKLRESTIFGNLFGGGILIMGADDGQDMSQPLDETKIKTIHSLTWIDRRFVVASEYYEEIGPKYGEVAVWNVINPYGNQANQYIHESRCLRFEGAPVDLMMRRRLAGWTLSKLQAPIETMKQFETSQQSVANLMSDISQAVLAMNGLARMIAADPKTLQTRMALVDMMRGSGRMIYIDAENEKFERVATPLTGVSDTIQMQMLTLAAAVEMPVALLFGREPSGLNATGDADFRRFYDMIAGDQKDILEPKLTRFYTLIFLAKDGPTKGVLPTTGFEFQWHKLYEPSELEQSTIRSNMATADDLYIANGTLLPEEVAMSRFRSGDLHLDTEIQGDLRRQKLATAQLAPSGAEKFQSDKEDKKAELDVKSKAIDAKGPPDKGPATK